MIHSKTGRDVSSVARSPKEREILFKPGSCFRIDSRSPESNGKIEINMTEVAPPRAAETQSLQSATDIKDTLTRFLDRLPQSREYPCKL